MDRITHRHRPLATLLVLVLLAIGLLGMRPASAAADGSAEAGLLALMNLERSARGLPPLALVADLSGVARGWSGVMAANNRMEHNPNFSGQLCCWRMVAENVGYATPANDSAVTRLHEAFMNSEGHRKHILDLRATQVGVGVEVRGNTVWATVNFRQPSPGAPAPTPRRQTPVLRTAGGDRISTAVAVSQQAFTSADAVVLARSDQYPDALAGAPLAALHGGPVLLTTSHQLAPATADEIRRLGATTAVLLGGTGAISETVERQLTAAGVRSVERVAGSSRVATAAAIARRVGGRAAYVVEGSSPDPARGWPDALSVAALAARQRRPILLVARDELPADTRDALRHLGVSEVTIVGGTAAVSDAVAGALAGGGTRVDRVAGGDRYATAAAVAERALGAGFGADQVWLATGRNWPDALAAGPAAARTGSALLLIDGSDPGGAPAIHRWLAARAGKVSSARLIGGPRVINEAVTGSPPPAARPAGPGWECPGSPGGRPSREGRAGRAEQGGPSREGRAGRAGYSDAVTSPAWRPSSAATPKAVGLVVHQLRPPALRAAAEAAVLLAETGVKVVGSIGDTWPQAGPAAELADAIELRGPGAFGTDLDVVLVFGGDGTLLRAAYLVRDCGPALLGVNLGRLGFLSEVEYSDRTQAIRRVAAGEFVVEERMTLSVEVRDPAGALVATSWALNEASVERTVPQRLVIFEARIGDVMFAHIPADAIICATPTGSTAYAFSAGGPILSPLVDAILLVPVAAHSLFNRTVVVDPDEVLTLRPVTGDIGCVVSLDGRETLGIPPGGSVQVSRGHAPVRMARLGSFDFYERVRDKFGLR